MKDQSASGILATAIDKIKDMVDCQTIIGDPIDAGDGIKVIPISKVTYGFASGGSDLPTKKDSAKDYFGGGSGAGVSITPIGFLSIYKGEVKLIGIEKYDGAADRIVGMVPEVIDKVSSFFKKDGKAKVNNDEVQTTDVEL